MQNQLIYKKIRFLRLQKLLSGKNGFGDIYKKKILFFNFYTLYLKEVIFKKGL